MIRINHQSVIIALMLFLSGLATAQTISFNDNTFKLELIALGIDTSGNNEIEIAEAELITSITLNNKGITDLTGLEHFINLENLELKENSLLSVPLTTLTKLTYLRIDNNGISELDLSNQSDLEFLYCPFNDLTELDLSNNSELVILKAFENDISVLNVNGLTSLETLFMNYNNLETIDISTLTSLEQIQLKGNGLTEIDVSNNLALVLLYVQVNELTDLNVSSLVNLTGLRVQLNSGLKEVCVYDVDLAESGGDFVKDSATTWIECVINDVEPRLGLNEMSISPNPTSAQVSISGDISSVFVYDALGNELKNSKSNIIDLSDQKSGVYFLRVSYTNGETHVERVLKD